MKKEKKLFHLLILMIIEQQVSDAGEGSISNPTICPSKQNCIFLIFSCPFLLFCLLNFSFLLLNSGFGPLQLLLSCGSEVTVYSQIVGYGMGNII